MGLFLRGDVCKSETQGLCTMWSRFVWTVLIA